MKRNTVIGVAGLAVFVASMVVAAVSAATEVRVSGPRGGAPVVLLHGLFRSSNSMFSLANALAAEGFRVCNVSYPSRHYPIEVLASRFVAPAVQHCFPDTKVPVQFVTHSMGGILTRQLAASEAVERFGRVVMLAPPNAGTEIVDRLRSWWLFGAVTGPSGLQLGTSDDSVPKRFGPAPFELGVIAGNRSLNPLFSHYLPGKDDGTVSVDSSRLEGMSDFVVVRAPHSLLMRDGEAIRQTIQFLKEGRFAHETAQTPDQQAAAS